MRLTIERDALQAAVSKARGVIIGATTVPILGNVLLEARDGRLWVRGAEPDMQVLASAPAEVEASGATTVPAARLSDLVRGLPAGGQVKLDLPADGVRLSLQCGRTRAQLPTLPAADYPEFARSDMDARASLPAKALQRILDRVAFAMSSEQTRYWLCGARLEVAIVDGTRRLRAIATDGSRLAYADTECPDDWDAAFTLPSKAVNELRALLGDRTGEVSIATNGSLFFAELDGVELATKLLDNRFPDYRRVIPDAGDAPLTADVTELQAALKRCAVVAADRSRAVTLKAQADQVIMTARSMEGGEIEDGFEVEYQGPDFEVMFNGRFLLEQAGLMAGERLRLHFSGPNDPVRFEDPADAGTVAVLMPLRF